MNARIVRRRYEFVQVDRLSLIGYPIAAVVCLSMVGQLLVWSGLVKSFYASAFVALSAAVANRVCLRAGMLTAALSVLVHEWAFAAPYGSIDWPSNEQALAYLMNFVAAYVVARRIPAAPATRTRSGASDSLPFAGSRDADKSRTFWEVEHTDDWAEDAYVGAEYGRIYLDRLRSEGRCPPLGWIIEGMISRGTYSGVEAGFAHAIEADVSRRKNKANKPD